MLEYEQIIETVKSKWNHIIEVIEDYLIRWMDRLEYYVVHNDYKEHGNQYQFCQTDIYLLEKIKSYKDENYPEGFEEKFVGLSDEEIIQKFSYITNDAATLMGVEIDDVRFFTPESEQDAFLYGFYNRTDNSININLAILLSRNQSLIKEQFFAVFHEMRHAFQWNVVTHPDKYSYPDELVAIWANNFLHYITKKEDDEAYFKQPLEKDTFGIEAVIKGEVTIESLKK